MPADFKMVKLNAHVAFLKVQLFHSRMFAKNTLKIRLLNTINSKILYIVVASY